MTFPRSRNGWVDDGSLIKSQRRPCPNCGSPEFKETISVESCPKCGLRFDYWGQGGNEVFKAFQKREAQRQTTEALERDLQLEKELREEHDTWEARWR